MPRVERFVTNDRDLKLAGFALFTGFALLVVCAVLLPQAYRDAYVGDPTIEFGARPQGPPPLIPPVLLGVAGLVSSGLGVWLLRRKRQGPGT